MLSYEVIVSIYKNITRFYAKCQNDYATPKFLWGGGGGEEDRLLVSSAAGTKAGRQEKRAAPPPSLGPGTGSISKKHEINRTGFALETAILIRISVHSLYSHLQMVYLYFLLLMFS